MMNKTKILVAGIGGVGGYFGGLLAKYYYNDPTVEIDFLARGAHLDEIKRNGLKVIKGDNGFIATPHLATDNSSEIGIADFVIISTKSYDLEATMEQLKPCIDHETVILPLLNGVDSKYRIKSIFPENIVLDGCVYIVARLQQAGLVENTGNIQTLYFGLDNFVNEPLRLLERLFKQANIEATLSQNISTILWEKFIFISPTATATSYFDNSIGEILADVEKFKMLTALLEEVKQVAKAKQIIIPDDITEKTLNKLKAMPFKATSSMHSDFQSHKPKNELQSLTGYVIGEKGKYNLMTPAYELTYAALSKH